MKFSNGFTSALAVLTIVTAMSPSATLAKGGSDDRPGSSSKSGSGSCDAPKPSSGSGSGSGGSTTANPRPRPARVVLFRLVGRAGTDDAGAIKAKADYRTRTRAGTLLDQRFNVEIHNGVPGTAYPVIVNGIAVGSITADTLGNGELELRLNPSTDDSADDDNDQPFPADFPVVAAGSTVQVAGLTITLRGKR